MNSGSRPKLLLALRGCGSLALIIILARQVDWAQLGQIFARQGGKLYLWLLPMAAIELCFYVLRWKILLMPLGVRVSFGEMASDTLIGLFYGLFIPTGLAGDLVRAARLGSRHGALSKTLISVAVDRLVGLLSVMILLGTYWLDSGPARQVVPVSWAGLLCLAPIAVAVCVLLNSHLMSAIHDLSNRWLPFFVTCRLDKLWTPLETYSQARRFVAYSLVVSIVYQLTITSSYYVGGRVLGIWIAMHSYVWIVALVSLAYFLPITIAGLGLREGVLALVFQQYGVSSTVAITLGLAIFSTTLLLGMLGGCLDILTHVWKPKH
jgi:uncharacterized protein (TIRG00374 family)